jgi:hypothetical protein
MMEDIGSSLDTLVEKAGPMFLLVDGYRKCLPTAIIDCIYKSYIEFFGMLSQMMGA